MSAGAASRSGSDSPWRTAWALARRDLHIRFRGLRLLFFCLFLGVAALAAIGSLSSAIKGEIESRGQIILGGDIEVGMSQRSATADELAALNRLGKLSTTVRMQAMAVRANGSLSAPAELKAVDALWPLYGRFTGADRKPVPRGINADEIHIAKGLAERLDVKPGDSIRFGTASYRVAGLIGAEPDRLGEGFSFGQVAITSLDGIARSGLIQPGSLYETKYRIALPPAADPAAISDQLKQDFSSSGWEIRTRDRAAPSTDRFVGRMGQFLILVALAALVIAGIGIANGVESYLTARRGAIATLKIMGATSGDVARVYLLQIAAVSLVATLAGLLVGVSVQPLLSLAIGHLLPVPAGIAFHPVPLSVAAAYGFAIALTFAAPALIRASDTAPLALMRDTVESDAAGGWRRVWKPVALGLGAILALVLITAEQPWISALFLAGAAAVLGLLRLAGWLLLKGVARLPRPASPLGRMALANLQRPGARTGALVTALGLGLTLFVLLASIQSSLNANIRANVPAKAPDWFVLDVPLAREGDFRALVGRQLPGSTVESVPAMRGSITAYGPPGAMTRVAELEDIPDDAWALRGERGLTYAETLPEGSELISGEWWPKGYAGEPLVSVDEQLAGALDLGVDDRIAISLLGVEREARIASIRRINWDTMGFNYVLVFSPNAIADAPHNLAVTIQMADEKPGAAAPDRGRFTRALLADFPSSSLIEVRDILSQAQTILGQMAAAITAAAGIAVLAGLAVLIGALAAARAAKSYDSVILKTLGATRRQLLVMQTLEFGVLASLLSLLALGLGSLTGWLVITQLFEFEWLPDWPLVLAVLGGGAVLVLLVGLAGSLPVLRARPAEALRSL